MLGAILGVAEAYLAAAAILDEDVGLLTTDEEVPEMDPVCNEQGTLVATVKKGEVVLVDTATKRARALTKGAGPTRSFGLAEFIAAEEMDRDVGMWWSPNGKRLIVFEVDESPVR